MLLRLLFPLTISAENVSGTFADSPIVNKQGKRFLDETTDRFTMTALLMEQEDRLCCMGASATLTPPRLAALPSSSYFLEIACKRF